MQKCTDTSTRQCKAAGSTMPTTTFTGMAIGTYNYSLGGTNFGLT